MFQKAALSYDDLPDGFPGQSGKATITNEYGSVVIFDSTNKINPGDFIVGEVDNTTKRLKYAVLAKGSITDKPILGVVTNNTDRYPAWNDSDPIPNGHCVNYLRKGAVYIKTTKDAQFGYWVYLKDADGSLEFDKAPTKASFTNTGFRVARGGKANSIILIESL